MFFDQAVRLRLHADVDELSGSFALFEKPEGDFCEVSGSRTQGVVPCILVRKPRFVGDGGSRNAALDAVREKPRQDLCEALCIDTPLGSTPVRLVYLVLDTLPVKIAVRGNR